ncbi:methyl-accepting chemotaxis protein [Vibrio sp. WJH972]
MFNNLKLAKKIGLGFALVLVLLTAVAFVGISGLNNADHGMKTYRSSVTDTDLMSRVQSDMLMVRLAVKGFLDSANESDVTLYKTHLSKLQQHLSTSESQITNPERKNIITTISSSISNYNTAFLEVITKAYKIDEIYNQSLVPHGEDMRLAINNLITKLGNSSNHSALLDAVELQRQMLVGRLFVVKYYESNKESDYLTAIENIDDAVTAQLSVLSRKIYNPDNKALLNTFSQNQKNYVNDMANIYQVVNQRNALVTEQLIVLGPQVAELAEQVKAMVLTEQNTLGDELKALIHQNMLYSITLSAIAIVLGIGVSVFLARRITQPISQAVGLANQLADGDLTIKVPPHSKDETGMLLDAVDNTANKLRAMIGTISQSSMELASASDELAVVTEQSSKGIMQQETESDLVATAMNEMATTVHDVANNASKASEAATQADQESMAGSNVVNLTIQSINELHDNVNNSSSKLQEVEKQVENISNILNVIKEIADQTNLLALNAAIEAARAGEQGRGFAVVADEVRSLAARTQTSTGEIQQIITQLQTGTKLTVEAMTEGKAHALTCVDRAEQTNEALSAITNAISLINEMNFQIASASEQQSTVAETINQNVENVRRIAQENAAGASQTLSSSREIAQLADNLNQMVVQFKV